METITIQITGEIPQRFRGERLATQESQRIETGSGAVWFELTAFRRVDGKLILVIRSQRRDWDSKRTVIQHEVDCNEEAMRAIRSFDYMSMIPPRVIAAPDEPNHRQIIDETTDTYYATCRRFSKKLDAFMSVSNREPADAESLRTIQQQVVSESPSVLIRLRDWLTT